MAINTTTSKTDESPQMIQNQSKDTKYGSQATVEILGEYNDTLVRLQANAKGAITVDTNGEANLTTKVDATDSANVYVGEAAIGSATSAAVWRISKIITASSITTELFADGNDNLDNVWNNRASLTYS